MEKKLLDKLNKLLALSKSPNVNEGNLALEMAEKLMNENGISYSDLDKENIENTLGSIDMEPMAYKVHNLSAWEKFLGQVIANHFDCLFFISKKSKNFQIVHAATFVGHESNRRTAIIMYEWLHKLIWKEANAKFSTWAHKCSFCVGAVDELSKKYQKEEKTENNNEKGLVVVDEVKQWVKNHCSVKSKDLTVKYNSTSYNAGKSLGSSLTLNKQFNLKAISA